MKTSVLKTAAGIGWVLTSALLIFASAAHTARAQTAPGGDAPRQETPAGDEEISGPGAEEGGVLASLNLSPAQRAQIVAIRRQSDTEGRVLLQRLRRARRALDASTYAEGVDEKVVEAQTREVADAQSEVIRLRASTELKLRRVLTPEQLGLLRDWRQRARLRQRQQRFQRNQPGNGVASPNDDALNYRLRRRQPATTSPPSDSPTTPSRPRRRANNPLRRQ